MAEHVAGTIDAGALAVPHAKHAIELTLAAQFGLLGAPERSGGKFLVDAGLKLDVGRGNLPAGAHELLVEAAERRTAISGDISRSVETGGAVARLLHQAGTDQRLIAGHKDLALGQIIFIVDTDGSEHHGWPWQRRGPAM